MEFYGYRFLIANLPLRASLFYYTIFLSKNFFLIGTLQTYGV